METDDLLKAPLSGNSLLVYKRVIEGERSFEELETELDLSRPVLSKHLKRLGVLGYVERNPTNRKYRATIWKMKLQDIPPLLNGTEPESIAAVARFNLELLAKVPPGPERTDLICSLLTSVFGFMAANLALNISNAIQCRRSSDVLTVLEKFYSSYLHPLGQILALLSWQNRKIVERSLELARSTLVDEADQEFHLDAALEIIEKSRLEAERKKLRR